MWIKRITPMKRRTFLRGAGGIAVGLPLLDIMLNDHGDALAGGARIPSRFFVGFNGQSMGGDGDPVHNLYVPDALGPNYDLKMATMPYGQYGDVREHISIVSNLRIPYGDPVPAGGWRNGFHLQALGPLLSGYANTDDSNYAHGITSDQIVANHAAFVGQTPIDSLQYQVQASWYLTDSAPYGRDLLSYNGAGEQMSNPGQISPKLAWQNLFAGFVPPDPMDAELAARELEKRKSILDLVRGDIERLLPKLGTVDQMRMQRHLDEIRDLEMQLDAMPPGPTATCMMLPDPGDDPPIGGNNATNGGDGFDTNAGYSDEYARARIFTDLVHMAFTCDMTRSITLLYTMAQSHMNVFPFTDIPYDQHEVGHSVGETTAVSQIIAWHLDHFAYLVSKLRDTPEGTGSVLDNCALVMLHEGGHGASPEDPANPNMSHSTENMIVSIAGHAGGLVAGQHIDGNSLHPCNVLITAMQAVGVDSNMGDVSGTVPGLIA